MRGVWVAGAAGALLAACGGGGARSPTATVASDRADGFAWPASLRVVGDGYPVSGAPCRRIGESAATVDFLDDSAALVGCPSRRDADGLGGQILKTIDGVILVSVANGTPAAAPAYGRGDARVPGTRYNATAKIGCAGYKGAGASMCDAGVIRGGAAGITVEVLLADATKRVIFFQADGKFLSFATAEADGTADLPIASVKEGDMTIARLGAETYAIPDAFVVGG